MFAFSRPLLRLAQLAQLVLLASLFAGPAALAQQRRPPVRKPPAAAGGGVVQVSPLRAANRPPPPPGSTFRIAGETDASQEMELEVGRSRVVHFRESVI